MELLILWLIIFALYVRTFGYYHLIDDYVEISGYYGFGIVPTPNEIFSMRISNKLRVWMITLQCLNITMVYLLFGFVPALILAVHPMTVWVTAWKTGNYYATAAFFTLVSYYLLHMFHVWWILPIAMVIYYAGINSTVCPLTFPFIGIMESWILWLFVPLAWFFKCGRLQNAMKVRNELYLEPTPKDWRRVFVMVKVLARYTYEAIMPLKLSLFSDFGINIREDKELYEKFHCANSHFWASLALLISAWILGWKVCPFGIFWFYALIGLHSQLMLTGQFYAQRYLYLPLIGFVCVLNGIWVTLGRPEWLLASYLTFLLIKTWDFIPKFRDMIMFMRNGVEVNPEYSICYNDLASHLRRNGGNVHEIAYLLERSIELNPKAWQPHHNLILLNIQIDNLKEALVHAKKGLELADNEILVKSFTGAVEEIEKKIKEAK